MKDPKKVAAGKKGATARWGEKRVLRLDELPPEVRAVVLNLIETAERQKGPDEEDRGR